MAFITPAYTWATGNTITAVRLNSNITNITDALSQGTKDVNVLTLQIGGTVVIDNSQNFITTGKYNLNLDGTAINTAGAFTYGAGQDAAIYWDGAANVLQQTTALTNTVSYNKLSHITSGTPATGIGTGIQFETETSAGNNEIGIVLDAVTTDVTAGSEDFDFVIKCMASGAAPTEIARFQSDGKLDLVSGAEYQINGTDVLSSTTLGTGVVNSSLTSVGNLTSLNLAAGAGYDINGTEVLNATTLGTGVVNSSLTSVGNLTALNLASGAGYDINGTEVLNATTLGTGVVNSSLTNVGTLTSLNLSGGINGTTGTFLVNNATNTFLVGNFNTNLAGGYYGVSIGAVLRAYMGCDDYYADLRFVSTSAGGRNAGFRWDNQANATQTLMQLYNNGDFYVSGEGISRSAAKFIGKYGGSIVTLEAESSNTSHTGVIMRASSSRAPNSAFEFLDCITQGSGQSFSLRGDGNAFADGTWSGGGADYAEYFESVSGKQLEPGLSVTIENGKVKEATEGDDVIGVTRPFGCSTIVGNSQWNVWTGKYQRDIFGSYILDEEGNRKLNPDYDESKEKDYVPREKREEWNIIGLMGQVQIKKGQTVDKRWIKMKEINSEYDLWFIR